MPKCGRKSNWSVPRGVAVGKMKWDASLEEKLSIMEQNRETVTLTFRHTEEERRRPLINRDFMKKLARDKFSGVARYEIQDPKINRT